MAIIQISKIQQRSGNIVDLPQLDEAEFGWATDVKRLYIGKTTPNENIEVLTSYSNISFSQLNGSYGNLNIDGGNIANGQVLAYNGSEWVNKGGNVGGLITLGDVSNVTIGGGAIGYVLETDGTGNLSWTPKSTIIAFIQNVTKANPGVITTTKDNFFVDGSAITITNVTGMTNLNGQSYYANVLTSNTFSLYSDSSLSTTVNTSAFGTFPNTTVTATNSTNNRVTVTSSSAFTINDPIIFVGTTIGGIVEGTTYYVLTKPTGTTITISETVGGTVFPLFTDSGSCTVYVPGGRIVSLVSGGSGGGVGGLAGGSNTMVQFNNTNTLDGSSDFTFNNAGSPKLLTLNGNANVGNLNSSSLVSASRFISNVATGTAPLTVTSTTRVANLNVAYSNVSDFTAITTISTGTQYLMLANATTGNVAIYGNANLSIDAATGVLTTIKLSVTGNANVGNLGFGSGAITGTGNITGGNIIGIIAAGSNTITTTGNITGGNLKTSGANGIVSGNNFTITGAATGNANASTITGNLGLRTIASTYTDNSAAASATIANTAIHGFGIPVLAAANTGVIATNAATIFIQGAPTAGTNITITNSYAMFVAAGNTYLGAGLTVAGNINTNNITTGSNTTAGSLTGNWSLTTGSRLQATYADLAEYYNADQYYAPGTVLEFGGVNELTIASDGSNKIAGVVSTDPAYAMNAKCLGEHVTPLALQGRVPTKVRGNVRKGDMMVSAGNGYARPQSNPQMGTVIGKALENFAGVEGVIEVVVGRL